MWYFRRLLFGLLAALSACDVPTALPKWNPVFALDIEDTAISLAQLLPPGIALTNSNTAFLLSLGPRFEGGASIMIALPGDVAGADVTAGVLHFELRHQLEHDPLRPPAGGIDSIIVAVRSGSRVLGSTTISGAARTFPPGSTLTDSIVFAGVVTDSLQVTVSATAMPSVFRLSVAPAPLLLRSARVSVQNRQLLARAIQLQLTDIDDFVIRRVRGGKLVLSIANGFGVHGSLTLRITDGFTSITRLVAVVPGETTIDVALTEAELASILGHNVTMSLTGALTADAALQITPASAFVISPLLILELGPDS